MNEVRRAILWTIFGFSMLMLWNNWQLSNGHKGIFSNGAPSQSAAAPAGDGTPVASAPGKADAPAQAASAAPATPAAPAVAHERFDVSTDVLKLTLDTEGGSLVRAELLKYRDANSQEPRNFVLLDDSKDRVYKAETGVVGGTTLGNFPTHKTVMAATGPRKLEDGKDELVLQFASPEVGGIKLVKTYTLRRGAYDIGIKHELINASGVAIAPQVYYQLVRDGNKPVGESSFYSTFTGPAVYTDAKKYQKVEFANIKKGTAEYEKSSTNGYIAMAQHYFASAWLLPDGVKRTISLDAVPMGSGVADCCYRASMLTPLEPIAPGAHATMEAKLFVGPQEEKRLEALAPGLELVKDYGWVTILAKPLYWLLDKLHGILQNWGWSIVALVLLLKIAFYWLNAKAYSSMAKMKAVNPRVMELRERLKDKPQEMQQEMMKIYREEKVNPLGGCFPIMIQIPVFIALYWVLLSSVEMRGAPWILWVKDLSAPDTSLGVWMTVPVGILPIVMTLTSLLQTALNPAPPDPMQAKMMWFMPLAFSVMFFFFPSGLVLYWITNNILSIAQQWIINTRMGVPPQFNLPKFK